MVGDAAFVREFAHPRVTLRAICRRIGPAVSKRGCWRSCRPATSTPASPSRCASAGRKRGPRAPSAGSASSGASRRSLAPSMVRAPDRATTSRSPRLASLGGAAVRSTPAGAARHVQSGAGVLGGAAAADGRATPACWSMAIDPSWDNFTNKLIPVRQVDPPDRLERPHEAAGDELHGYDAGEIRVAGAPQLDRYFRDAVTVSRRGVLRAGWRRSCRKLLTLTTTPRALYPHHDHVLRALARAMRERRPRAGAGAGPPASARRPLPLRRVRACPGRDHREAVPRHGQGRRRPGHRRHAGASGTSATRCATPTSSSTSRRRSPSRRHLRHAGRQHLLRRPEREPRLRGRRGATTASRTT